MKIVMEKNRTNREIREALREVYEQVAEAAADAQDLDYFTNYVLRNKAILLAHWNGEIGSEEVVRGLVF